MSQNKWELLNPKPSFKTGKNIKFISENVGYILNNTEILETHDSGITWTKKQDINSGNDLKFYKNVGYVIGNDGYMLKSVDFGASWTEVKKKFSVNFNTISIINETTVVISSSNSIIKSVDGGNTWNNLKVPNATINKTFFTTSLIGHAACTDGRMFKTIDGGASWYATTNSNVVAYDFSEVYFLDENIGFSSTNLHSNLYKTTDGGETWWQIPNMNDAFYTFSFVNESVGYAAGLYGVIFKTIDGGLNWKWASFQDSRIFNTGIYGIHFLDSETGFATGARGRIIKTTDGGKTWVENSPNYYDINNLQFSTNEIGIAKSGNLFFKTINSGVTWEKLSSIDADRISAFEFVSENLAYAAIGDGAYEGIVFKTLDGGRTWNKSNGGLAVMHGGIDSMSFLSENVGVVSGRFGVKKTTDGGNTWVGLSDNSFQKMQFLNKNIGYGYNSYSKKVYKTINGGGNWEVVFTAEEDIKSIDFVDEDTGYVVGAYGLLFKTNNGGLNWTKLEIPYKNYLYVKFYSKNVGYVFDIKGKLYKTENGGKSWDNIFKLEQSYETCIISIIGKDIYVGGASGIILKSKIDFKPTVFQLNPAENILARSAVLSGNVSVNEGSVDNVRVEYFDSSLINKVSISAIALYATSSLDFSLPISNLEPNKTYYYRIVGSRGNVSYYSEMMTFVTKEEYSLAIDAISNVLANKAEIKGNVTSYGSDISDVEFQYTTKQDFLKYDVLKSSTLVKDNTTEKINGNLLDLKPKTNYYVRLKAKQDGKEIFSSISTFTTLSEYEVILFNPSVVDNSVTLSAYIDAYSNDITNVVFEYGVLNYENSISTNVSQVLIGTSAYVTALLTNLDSDKIYFYRLKALNGANVIYSKDGIFNLSKRVFLKAGNVIDNNNQTTLTGYINPFGAFLTNIEFEYGTTESLGSSIVSTPNNVYGYAVFPFNAVLDNLIKGEKYYYRLKAFDGDNNKFLYSDLLSFTTQTLGIEVPILKNNIFLYPNPTNGVVNVNLIDNKKVISVYVIDELGKITNYENSIKAGVLQKIDLSGKSSGIYIIKIITDDNSIINKKVILK
ncbi:YCF48-related protein [Flavobacterium sp. PL02]|uniref:T9SS type A sorting domain-containing protein n=1 Tax=Flavobacterium sp. PL02 TaxID=3088354 RepID=UPI002B22A645|nr:YCF48-related protein [Flavobacterium sp. PL02]MEA9412347.1 YCF48-related protein [Flavobacterium sp. PL02]